MEGGSCWLARVDFADGSSPGRLHSLQGLPYRAPLNLGNARLLFSFKGVAHFESDKLGSDFTERIQSSKFLDLEPHPVNIKL